MINGSPEDHGFKRIVPQAAHDYFKRELHRDMDAFELKVLEDMTQALELANAKLIRKGHANKVRNVGSLYEVFVDRVREQEADSATRKIMVGYTGGKRDAS
jgi:hypothetical protein